MRPHNSIAGPRVIRGAAVSLEQAVFELLPESGSVEVQRDTAGREHPAHTHPADEILLVVKGDITFRLGGGQLVCSPGDRLLLPVGTEHSSVAGSEGCVYVIATR